MSDHSAFLDETALSNVLTTPLLSSLLDPGYASIGPDTCVGMTGGWASFSWPPAIALTSTMGVFLMDFAAERYVEYKYGLAHSHQDVEALVTDHVGPLNPRAPLSHHQLHSGDQDESFHAAVAAAAIQDTPRNPAAPTHKEELHESDVELAGSSGASTTSADERSFRQQIAAFLILEFGVIFHSVIIGLNLGTAGSEFSTLYPVIVFHQSFEGLGIGARMSAIPFPSRVAWLPWVLCTAYGLTTPLAIAIGLGVRTTYNAGSFTANVVSGVLDSTSAGILIYTGLVELLARDFLFNPELTRDSRRLTFMVVCVFLGCGLMALLGKWA